MNSSCKVCQKKVATDSPQFVTCGLCNSCAHNIESSAMTVAVFINSCDMPLLYMQGDPRQVVTAHHSACRQFNKELVLIERKRGGQVLDCIHSYTEAGCGKDQHCEDCKIKNAIIDTFVSGKSHKSVNTTLEIRIDNQRVPHSVAVTTEKIESHVLVRIDEYRRLPNQAL